MNQHDQEGGFNVTTDDIKKAQDAQQKLSEAKQNLGQNQELADEKINEFDKLAQLKGTPIQIAQQHSLVMFGLLYAISSLLSMTIIWLEPVKFIIGLIPMIDFLSLVLFLLSLFCIQFMPTKFDSKPMNFFLFLIHSLSRIILLVYVTLWFPFIKFELVQLLMVLISGYMLYNVKNAANQISLGEGHPADFTVKTNFCRLMLFTSISTLFLVILTQQKLYVLLLVALVGMLYAFFVLLAVQRYQLHTFLTYNNNSVYLGASQIDADLILCCYLIGYHCCGKKNTPAPMPSIEQKPLVKDNL